MTLAAALAANILDYQRERSAGTMTLERRAVWLHHACRRVAAAMGIRVNVSGSIPERGLIVSNHLSYLDILVYGAVMPCFFVSKMEVERWPYFGWAARTGGAMFLDRTKRSSASAVAQEIAVRLPLAAPVMLFPEGTSTDGSELLRFHSGLFAPAVKAAAPVTTAAIRYVAEGGVQERELCWFGDAPFLPHLLRTLGMRGFSAEVRFGETRIYSDRRNASASTWAQIAAMRGYETAAGCEPRIPALPPAN